MQIWQRLSGRHKQALRVFVYSALTTLALIYLPFPFYERLELSLFDQRLDTIVNNTQRVQGKIRYYTVQDSTKDAGLDDRRLLRLIRRLAKAEPAKVVILNPEIFEDFSYIGRLPDSVEWLDTRQNQSGNIRDRYRIFLGETEPDPNNKNELVNLYDIDGRLRGVPWNHPAVTFLLDIMGKTELEPRGDRLMLKPRRKKHSVEAAMGYSSVESLEKVFNEEIKQGRKFASDSVRGSIVLIGLGTTKAGNFAEISTSRGIVTAGHVYGQLGQSVYDKWFPAKLPQWVDILAYFMVVGCLCFSLSGRTPTKIGLYGFPSLGVVYCISTVALYFQVDAPIGALLSGMVSSLLYLVLLELVRSRSVLRSYGGAEDAGFEGQESQATMLFTNLPPHLMDMERNHDEKLLEFRREYNEILARIATKFHGKVLDYQGDAQMLGFGLRHDDEDNEHPAEAAAAALQIVTRVEKLAKRWDVAPEKLKVHVGVCTGSIALGHLGAVQKQDIAAIGDTTNTAARLMGAAMKQKVPVLVSRPTFEQADGVIEGTELPPVELKGKALPVEVFAAHSVDENWIEQNVQKSKGELSPRGGRLDYGGSRKGDLAVTIVIGLVGFFISLGIWRSGVLDEAELVFEDALHKELALQPADERIVVVGIDEESITDPRLPRFPWPRSVYAQVIHNLKDAGHRGLFFDVMFKKAREGDAEGDALFAQTLAEEPRTVIAGALFRNERFRLEDPQLFPAADFELLRSRYQIGLIHSAEDEDGHLRSGFVTAQETESHGSAEADKRHLYPAAAAALLISPGDEFKLSGSTVTLRDRAIKVKAEDEGKSTIRLRFGPATTSDGLPPQEGSYKFVSFSRLLDTSDPIFQELKGKYLMVGQTLTTGESNEIDRVETVVGRIKGVEAHARILDNLLNENYFYVLPVIQRTLLLAFVCGCAIWVLVLYRRASAYVPRLLILVAAIFALHLVAFQFWHVLSELLYLWMGIVVVTVAVLVGRFVQTFRALTRVIPAEVAAELMFYHETQDRRQVATILLTDIRGYTTLSEGRTAVAMLDVLNEYHKRTVACYDRHGGQALTYQGDAQIVIFGVFGNRKNPAADAVAAALGLQAICDDLREEWGIESRDDFDVGAGLCTGEVEVGLLGGGSNLQYSVVGETVRKAHKVQSLSADLEAPVILDEETFEATSGAVEVDDLGLVQPKGLPHEIRLYRATSVK